jgi:hypothetical protein
MRIDRVLQCNGRRARLMSPRELQALTAYVGARVANAMVPVLCCRQLMLQLSGAKAPRVPTKEVADCSPDPLELECLLVASSSNLLLITG